MAEAGIREATPGGEFPDRDIVVLSDRTPAEWLSREDLRDPVGLVATSIRLPVRGALQRFQWVDYRARRTSTLQAFRRDLRPPEGSEPEPSGLPDLPESLELPRLPRPVVIVEWILFCVATLATLVATYTAVVVATADVGSLRWRTVACVAVTPAALLLALRLQRRRITPWRLVLGLALCLLAMIALGLDGTLQSMYPDYDRGRVSALTFIFPAACALVIAGAWRPLRRWLPRSTGAAGSGAPTLGHARPSTAWVALLAPALIGAIGLAIVNTSLVQGAEPPYTASDRCLDQNEIIALGDPLGPVNAALARATPRTARRAYEDRIRATTRVRDDLRGVETRTAWGADIRERLVHALEKTVQADRLALAGGVTAANRHNWEAEYAELGSVATDLEQPVC